MEKKASDSLLFRFSAVLLLFTVLSLMIGGVATYFSQMKIYKEQCEQNVRSVGQYLAHLMNNAGDDVLAYKDYYMKHYKEVDVPYFFTDYEDARDEFELLMVQNYPGMAVGEDIMVEELAPEVQKAWFVYMHEFWLTTFEAARESFHLPYTYFLVMVPDEETCAKEGYVVDFKTEPRDNVVYMIDGERTMRDGRWLYLGDTYFNPREKYGIVWRTWDTGEKQDGYMEWDNEWGHTYGYYTPLIINGQKVGLVVSEIDVKTVNQAVLRNTLQQIGLVGLVVVIGVIMMMMLIFRLFIEPTRRLEENVRIYANYKDADIADRILEDYTGRDELSSLGRQFAKMINELTSYMENLMRATRELDDTRQHAEEMTELANKDPLTGIRNKNAFDKEIQRLRWELQNGEKEFGFVMLDLNDLKHLNDNYGHERGNSAVKKLCKMVCSVFEHSPVFRVGGDEFVAVLLRQDYHQVDELVARLEAELAKCGNDETLDPWERISAAYGVALYDESIDGSVGNVFQRADKAMYTRKQEMKAHPEKGSS